MSNQTHIPIVSKKTLFPFIIITSLFAFRGLASDMINPMVRGFQKVLSIVGEALMSFVQGCVLSGYVDTSFLGVSEMRYSFFLSFLYLIVVAIYGRKVYTKYSK